MKGLDQEPHIPDITATSRLALGLRHDPCELQRFWPAEIQEFPQKSSIGCDCLRASRGSYSTTCNSRYLWQRSRQQSTTSSCWPLPGSRACTRGCSGACCFAAPPAKARFQLSIAVILHFTAHQRFDRQISGGNSWLSTTAVCGNDGEVLQVWCY